MELVTDNLEACQRKIAYKQTLCLVSVEKVLLYGDLEVMCTVLVALNFNPADVVHPEVILLDVNNSRDVLVYAI